VETLRNPGFRHRRIDYNDCEGDGIIESFHRSLKVKEDWINEHLRREQARDNVARWIKEHNHDHPNCGLQGITPDRSRAQYLFQTHFSNLGLSVSING
jgi:transposase InsO family protein